MTLQRDKLLHVNNFIIDVHGMISSLRKYHSMVIGVFVDALWDIPIFFEHQTKNGYNALVS